MVIFFTPKSILLQLVCQVSEDDIPKLRQTTVSFTWVSHTNNKRYIRHKNRGGASYIKMSMFNSHLQLEQVSAVCWVQPLPDTKYSGLSYRDREEVNKGSSFKYHYDHWWHKLLLLLYIWSIVFYLECMTYLMARHTSLWISAPIWSTGAISSCHRSRPERRTLSLFCSDWGLKNLKTT